jgi:hypothetical protein
MPNWNSNIVTISSDDGELINKVIDAALKSKESESFFNVLVPRPVSEDSDWYSWNVNNWGTKWDTGVDLVEKADNSVTLSFDTAWSPPIGFYAALEEMGYEVDAYYFEPGMCFAGHYNDGMDDYYEYSGMNSSEVAEMLPMELNEIFCISESMAEWESENQEIDLGEEDEEFNTEEE